MDKKLIEEFINPGSEYRGAPFWAWNGKLEPEELRRQIRIMHKMGLGGFFMHSRVGLNTAYLSDEWFKCVDACIDEAEKFGMRAWLYDEDRWPSGAAGGLVTKNPKFRHRSLIMKELKNFPGVKSNQNKSVVFTANINGSNATNIKRIFRGPRRTKLKEGETILQFGVEIDSCSSWYNDQTYLDTMNHEAVQEFIKVTHEAYRKKIGKYFGNRVPGIFTDEPNYGNSQQKLDVNKISIPWTDKLPAVFKKRYGYDLIPHLPELFFDVDGRKVSQVRYHYHDCITYLFVDAFARQIGEWCDKNNMQFTGHILSEERLSSQTGVVGNCMRFYEYMQAPGMDLLTEHNREYDTAKQVSSVAHQFGRKWRLTETYGCTGWDFPFVGHKALGNWQTALGINLRAQHLAWYTMEGQAKRDYPAAIFYQSPWWEIYSKVENYFARINAVMTRGNEVRDVLVIHPVESMWLLCKKDWMQDPNVHKYDTMLSSLRDSLLDENIDFDYGDEEIIAHHGRISRKNSYPAFCVRKAAYKAVIVPPLTTIRSTTLELLKKFKSAGGSVVFAGESPQYVDAVLSTSADDFAKTCAHTPAKGEKLAQAVEKTARRVSIADENGNEITNALYLLREDKDAFYLFVCNTGQSPSQIKASTYDPSMVRDRTKSYDNVRIKVFSGSKGAGQPLELDPDTGKIFSANAKRTKSGWNFYTSLPAIGSRLFVIPTKKGGKKYACRKVLKNARKIRVDNVKWNISLSENNVLVLDRPRSRIGTGGWRNADEILRVDSAVRNALKIQVRGGQMVQPWARKRSVNPKHIPITLEYTFDVRTIPSGNLYLAVEKPDTFIVKINNESVSMDAECGWWCDRSLRKLPINPALLHLGKNEIIITCEYDENHPGLEAIYLLGNFGVKVKGTNIAVTPPVDSLKIGDWVKQGLPFYSGSVSYCKTIKPKLNQGERLFVQVPEYRGTAVRILVNGKNAGIIAWQPNEIDITDLIGNSPANISIEVIGHRRNSHGPFHLTEKWPRWTGPGSFISSGKDWTDSYQMVPCGLMKSPKLIVRKQDQHQK